MAACREYLPHTDPFGSVQHCPTGSTQPSLPDHLAAIAITRVAYSAQQAITHCPASGVVSSCQQPSIQDRCETSSSADLLFASLDVFYFSSSPSTPTGAAAAPLRSAGAKSPTPSPTARGGSTRRAPSARGARGLPSQRKKAARPAAPVDSVASVR